MGQELSPAPGPSGLALIAILAVSNPQSSQLLLLLLPPATTTVIAMNAST